jgi:hypothetical protein
MSDVITVERLERALVLCAYLVELDGPVMVPLFERLERELAAKRETQDAVDRAKRLLEHLGLPMQRNLLLTSRYNNRFNDDIFGTAIEGA